MANMHFIKLLYRQFIIPVDSNTIIMNLDNMTGIRIIMVTSTS